MGQVARHVGDDPVFGRPPVGRHRVQCVSAVGQLGIDEVRIQRVADVMQQFGFLKRRFDVHQLLG